MKLLLCSRRLLSWLTAAPLQIDVDRALQEGMSALASRDYNKAKADFEAVLDSTARSPGGTSESWNHCAC